MKSLESSVWSQANASVNPAKFVAGVSSLATAMMVGQVNVLGKVNRSGDSGAAERTPSSQEQSTGRGSRPKVLVFDVNQTLLDLNALRPLFARIFGDADALEEWFLLLLQYSMVVTLADAYADFGTVGGAVLEMLSRNKNVALTQADRQEILHGLVTLPAHPEVRESLKQLRAAGFRMITLTNSSPAGVKSQLESAKLAEYFEQSISVDAVRRFKPDTAVYNNAAERLGEKPEDLLLIAAHAWDVFGAMKAGWRAAFVAREGITLFPLGPKPEIIGPDINAVAAALLA